MRRDQVARLSELGTRVDPAVGREVQRVIHAAERKEDADRSARYAAAEAAGADVVVGSLAKGNGEIRIAVRTWEGGKTVDMRVFAKNEDGALRATRKALQVDAAKLPALLDALKEAMQHV